MNCRMLLALVPLTLSPFIVASPAFASGHRGWCIGVDNPHRSSSCSSTTPVIQPNVDTKTPMVNQVQQPQTLVPTPSQIRIIPKRPPESRQSQPIPTLVVGAIVAPPAQSTVTNPQMPEIAPPDLRPTIIVQQPVPTATPNPITQATAQPLIAPPLPQGPQPIPTGTPNPQQPPVVLIPVIAPTLSTQAPSQVPVAVPNPQTPAQLPQPVIAPPLPQGPQAIPTATPNPQQPPVMLTPVIAPTLSTQAPSQVPVAVPNPQTPAQLPQPVIAPPLPQGPQAIPIATPNPQQPPVVLTPVIAPTLSTQAPSQVPVAVPNPQTPAQLPQPVIAPPLPQGPQAIPIATPNPQQPPVMLTPVIAPTLSTQAPSQLPVAVPNPQNPAQLPQPVIVPPLPQGPQAIPIATPNPQQPPITLAPQLTPQPQIQTQPPMPVAVPSPMQQQPPIPIIAPPLLAQTTQGPMATNNPQGPVVIAPLERPTFATRGPQQPPIIGPATIDTTIQSSGALVPPPLQQPPNSTSNLPVAINPPTIMQPLQPQTFNTVTQPQRPITANGTETVVVMPNDRPNSPLAMLPQVVKRPRQYDRPSQEVVLTPPGNVIEGQAGAKLPNNLVAVGLGRHPAHQLPIFDLPEGRRQCLLSGFGRRYIIGPDGRRKVTGMSPALRGFGPIMRDVPAFSHRTAGCILLVERRED